MRLVELEPQFLQYDPLNPANHHFTDGIRIASGIVFICPKCAEKTKVGAHSVICWNETVPQTINPGPGRWNMTGTGYDDLSLIATSIDPRSSVQLTNGCRAHFHITNGEIRMC